MSENLPEETVSTLECPLTETRVSKTTCNGCMYQSAVNTCIKDVTDTQEYAKLRGIRPADIEKERTFAETRIQAGLCLFTYLEWVRERGLLVEGDPIDFLEKNEVLSSMSVTSSELRAMAKEENWSDFQKYKGIDLPFRLAQVLMIGEAQLDDLSI